MYSARHWSFPSETAIFHKGKGLRNYLISEGKTFFSRSHQHRVLLNKYSICVLVERAAKLSSLTEVMNYFFSEGTRKKCCWPLCKLWIKKPKIILTTQGQKLRIRTQMLPFIFIGKEHVDFKMHCQRKLNPLLKIPLFYEYMNISITENHTSES